jgi:hypothetical protein
MPRTPYPTINPDGLDIKVNWKKLKVGESVFIPCINTQSAKGQVQGITRKMGFVMRYRVRIENGYYGLRCWRIG